MEACDILILGAGAAGMPAAIFASNSNRRVMLIEAADKIGGTFHLSSGQMSAAGTRIQAAKGIVDSAEDHFKDVMRINRGTANPALVKLATDHAADTLHWLLDIGLELLPEHPIVHFGHEPYSTARTYWGPEEGRSVLKVLAPQVEAAVAEGRLDLRLSTRLLSLARLSDGRMRATLVSGDNRYEVDAGAVVIATGGYSANPELFAELSNGYPLYGGGYPHARGQGLVAALGVGGVVVNRDYYLPTFAGVAEAEAHGGFTFATQTYPQFRQPWEVYVDSDGARFMREDDPSVDNRERALLAQPGMRFWALFDDGIRRQAPSFFTLAEWPEISGRFNRLPAYRKADTLAELAVLIGADVATLEASIAAYNTAIETGAEDPFGREHRPLPLAEGPYYAVEHVGWSIVGFAGLAVDGDLRVTDKNGDVIPGLYAAGEVLGMGATSGNAFSGGMSVTPAMTFGRLLGQRLAEGGN